MEKKELIGFILNDIKELELIARGMHEMDKVSEVMQELAISKTSNILNKFCQLKEGKKVETKEEKTVFQSQLFFAEEKIVEEEFLAIVEQQPEEVIQQPEVIEQQPEKAVQQQPEVIEQQPEKAVQQPEEEQSAIVVQEEKKVQERITNEKFKFRIPAVNPVAATGGKRIESRFVQNLRKAINLNDKYRYQKELFGGNVELMNNVIDKLDAMESLEEAKAYVQREFTWDAESETAADFYLLLESRFS